MLQKSRFILLPAIMLLSLFAFGQEANTIPQFQIGVRAGANYANFRALKNSDILNNKENTFIMVGGFAQVRILKKLGLRAEILSNPKGSLINYYDSGNVKVEAVRKLQSTDATLSLIYNFKLLGAVGMYAFGGYTYESFTSVKDDIQEPYNSSRDVTNSFVDNAHSIIGGLGIRIRIGSVNILPEIRYQHGLTDIVKTNVETKNQVVTGSIGISFTL